MSRTQKTKYQRFEMKNFTQPSNIRESIRTHTFTNITRIRCQIAAITSQDIFAYGKEKNVRILREKLRSYFTRKV